MPTIHLLNLNYRCNERCVFCAADLGGHQRQAGASQSLSFEDVLAWLARGALGASDRVLLAGGEPTLHRDLIRIIRHCRESCSDVRLFTNGLRLADSRFARSLVEAGVTRFEIALFGSTAGRHDAVTQTPGSFERTLSGIRQLLELREAADFIVEIRLLVARHTLQENPRIVRMLSGWTVPVDVISLNRLILSEDARDADAAVSWEAARASVNATASLIRASGSRFLFGAVPFCVFEGENATFVRRAILASATQDEGGRGGDPRRTRYLDPTTTSDWILGSSERTSAPGLPDPCLSCDLISRCLRVEEWHLERFGSGGLRPVALGPAEPA